MRKAAELLKTMQETPSKNEKERLLAEYYETGDREFFIAARVALNPTTSFGITTAPIFDDFYDGDLSFEDMMLLANRLRTRELTGHAARDAIRIASERANSDDWNYFFRRIILADFKAGFSHSTVNRVLDKIKTPEAASLKVPVFSPQLAVNSLDHPKKMVGDVYLDVKLNGVRLLSILDKETGTVTQFSRNGHVNENFPHLRAELAKLIPDLPVSVVLDGEVCATTFQELMKQLTRKDNIDTNATKLSLFDIVPLRDFNNGKSALTQEERNATLMDVVTLIQEAGLQSVVVLPKIKVNLDTPEGRDRMAAFREEVMAAQRNEIATTGKTVIEGFMIKPLKAPYVCKKGSNWLKWKPSLTVDLTVVGLEAGDAGKKYANTLGALVCEGEHEGKFVRTRCATGISDQERDLWWNDPSKIVGFVVEIHADELTQNEKEVGTNTYSLRFPAFYSVRGTVAGEKI